MDKTYTITVEARPNGLVHAHADNWGFCIIKSEPVLKAKLIPWTGRPSFWPTGTPEGYPASAIAKL